MTVHIDSDRLWNNLMDLAEFRDKASPGWTRRSFTAEYLEARQWLRGLMESAGLQVALDAGANLVGSRTGSTATQLVVGSHTDTVTGAGRFDGMLGVIAAIECATVLQETSWPFKHGLKIYDFLAEEPSPYGVSTVGSRAVSGHLPPILLALEDPRGETLANGIRRIGGNPAALTGPLLNNADIAAFLELHVEQGPYLETHGIPLGIVTGIVGIRRYRVIIHGSPGHAGTTPMDLRRDALVGASIIVSRVNQWANERAGNLVATVGRINVEPNALNVIPGVASLGVEARALDRQQLDLFESFLKDLTDSLASTNYEVSVNETTREDPVLLDPSLRKAMADVFLQNRWTHAELPSWAGHDAVQMVHVCSRSAMIFVPSHRGLSHCPEEWTEPRDAALGAEALLQCLLRLDRDLN